MALVSINKVFPNGWDEIAANIKTLREGLFGTIPEIPAIDISDLEVPGEILEAIRDKNRRRIREEIPLEEFVGENSPFRTDAFFDDQLFEVISSISYKYQPEELIRQHVAMIDKFLNESAAFVGGNLQDRIDDRNASVIVSTIKTALDLSHDPDERQTLELLLVDLTYGGEESWVAALQPALKAFVQDVVARQSG